MPVIGIGVDVVHFPRIISLMAKRGHDRLARRILSPEELQTFRPNSPDCARFLAVRFSVKEAAYKAIYPHAKPTWKDFTYRSVDTERAASKPQLFYHPSSGGSKGTEWRFHVSVSHDGEYVFSNVLVEDQ
ncbi:4'-phosphopantetheinyl transferase [Schizopora paradoxa]|uniref:4'-phosphopantetheinyl transferase n=1 Tax=Schizopora paradoxa TaxID=27342 RepID=A0A0H2SGV7_9AGAM|nr:4'-phosphopantetheinyl transferase [Schizopora paradoxa]